MAVVVRSFHNALRQQIRAGESLEHELVADEPRQYGGTNEGPDPYDLLLAALGSCTAMTLAVYARRKGWKLEEIQVSLRHDRVYAIDCRDCETKLGLIDRIHRAITLNGDLNPGQRERLMEIAARCPLYRTLVNEVRIQDELVAVP